MIKKLVSYCGFGSNFYTAMGSRLLFDLIFSQVVFRRQLVITVWVMIGADLAQNAGLIIPNPF